MALTALLALLLASSFARAEEGGYKDPATGKVWGQSVRSIYGGSWSWDYCTNLTAGYGVWDLNAAGVPTYYDDWRLPTLKEVRAGEGPAAR